MLLQNLIVLSLIGLIDAVDNEDFGNPKISNVGETINQIKNVSYSENAIDQKVGDQKVVNEISRWLSELVYRPVIVLANDEDKLLEDAEKYLNVILKNPIVRNDFSLTILNDSDISKILEKTTSMNLNEFRGLLKSKTLEEKLDDENMDTSIFLNILKATRILQPGSGILVFTDEKNMDEDSVKIAIKKMFSKQIGVFGVWNGSYPSVNDEEMLLKEVSLLPRGFFFVGNTERKFFKEYYSSSDNSTYTAFVAHKANIDGLNILNVPIDKGVRRIHVSLTGAVNLARFNSPNGYLIDLLNVTDVGRFSRGSYCIKLGEIYEIQLNTAHNKPTPVVGIWRLKTDAFAQHYNITISIQKQITLTTQIDQNKRETLRLDLQGDFTNIDNISIVDKFGEPFHQKLQYNFTGHTKESLEIETFKEEEYASIIKTIPQQPFYIKVNGKDLEGKDFARLSYFNPHNPLPGTTIDIGLQSELLLIPNQRSNIFFEVTNNKNQVTNYNFQCNDDKRLLVSLSPSRFRMNPQQTITVTVTVYARPIAGVSYRDFVTFYAISASERYTKEVLIDVNANPIKDFNKPYLSHKYTSDCLSIILAKCDTGTWNAEVTVQDKESGLLKLSSEPSGYFPNGFTSGTTELVTARYSGSCCYPELKLLAIDRSKNRVIYKIDAYKAAIGPGTIAAIVLGILLIIAVIVVIVLLCKCGKCKRKQKGSMELPTTSYRGPINSASTTRY